MIKIIQIIDIEYYSEAELVFASFRIDERGPRLLKNFIMLTLQAKTRAGIEKTFSVSPEICMPFGFFTGERGTYIYHA